MHPRVWSELTQHHGGLRWSDVAEILFSCDAESQYSDQRDVMAGLNRAHRAQLNARGREQLQVEKDLLALGGGSAAAGGHDPEPELGQAPDPSGPSDKDHFMRSLALDHLRAQHARLVWSVPELKQTYHFRIGGRGKDFRVIRGEGKQFHETPWILNKL